MYKKCSKKLCRTFFEDKKQRNKVPTVVVASSGDSSKVYLELANRVATKIKSLDHEVYFNGWKSTKKEKTIRQVCIDGKKSIE